MRIKYVAHKHMEDLTGKHILYKRDYTLHYCVLELGYFHLKWSTRVIEELLPSTD